MLKEMLNVDTIFGYDFIKSELDDTTKLTDPFDIYINTTNMLSSLRFSIVTGNQDDFLLFFDTLVLERMVYDISHIFFSDQDKEVKIQDMLYKLQQFSTFLETCWSIYKEENLCG